MRESMIYNGDVYQFREDVLLKIITIIKSRTEEDYGKTLFFGDSLVEQIPDCFDIINCGLGGTCSRVWESLLDELVIKFKPKKVYFHIGTNDLGETTMESPRSIALNIQRITYILERNLPNTSIYVISTLPCIDALQSYTATGRTIRSNAMIEVLNREIQEHLQGSRTQFIGLYDHMFDNNSQLKERYYVDGLHLNDEGYHMLNAFLKV